MHPLLQFFKNNAILIGGATLVVGAMHTASIHGLGGKPTGADIATVWGLALLSVVGAFTQKYMEGGSPMRRKPVVAKIPPPEARR